MNLNKGCYWIYNTVHLGVEDIMPLKLAEEGLCLFVIKIIVELQNNTQQYRSRMPEGSSSYLVCTIHVTSAELK